MSCKILKDVVLPVKSSLKLSDLETSGNYQVFGASGLVGYRNSFQTGKESVGVIKDGAGIGRVTILPKHSSVLGTMQILEPKEGISNSYLFFFLSHLNLGKSFTGSTIPHIYFKNYCKAQFPEISYKKQCEIAGKLKKISELIGVKRKQETKLDSLVKSRFMEMFANVNKQKLSEMAEIIMGQSPDSKSYNELGNGLPFLQGKGDFGEKYTKVEHWTTLPTKTAKLNDVLMSVRAPVGPVNIASTDCCIGRGLCAIRAENGLTNSEFLYNALKVMEPEIALMGNGSTFKAINKKDVYSLLIPVASVQNQESFSKFASLVDKSRFVVQQEIKDLQELLDSKMEEYFGGEE